TEHGEPGRLPLTVHGTGTLRGGRLEVDAAASSQFISNMLLVAAHAEQDVELVHVGEVLPSLPHIDMTMETLRQAGAGAPHDPDAPGRHAWRGPHGRTPPGAVAAYRDLLTRRGGEVWREGTALCVRGTGELHGIDADMSAMGELVPTMSALCALADSPSRLTGVAHLRGHETDRLKALATELSKVGARTVELEDGVEIHPGELHGAVFESYEDHRMATAGAILGLRVADLRVVDIGTTQKTLPDFVGMWLSMLHPEPGADDA